MCVVEFSGLHSNFLVCKLQLQFCSVNVFTVFLYFLQNYSVNHSCQNYFVKTTEFFLQCEYEVFGSDELTFFYHRQTRPNGGK